jgi:hypothetical protein
MGLDHASVMRSPHPKGADRLRDRPFHSGSLLVLFFEFLGLLAPPTCLQRFVCFLRADCDRSPRDRKKPGEMGVRHLFFSVSVTWRLDIRLFCYHTPDFFVLSM